MEGEVRVKITTEIDMNISDEIKNTYLKKFTVGKSTVTLEKRVLPLLNAIGEVLNDEPVLAMRLINSINEQKMSYAFRKEERRKAGIEKRKGPRKPRYWESKVPLIEEGKAA